MAEPSSKTPAPTSPTRPSHRVNRSITEISPPTLKTSHRPHHLRNSSHHHYYHNSRRARSSDKDGGTHSHSHSLSKEKEPSSAHPNLRPLVPGTEVRWRDGVKSEFGTPAQSRRASGAAWDPDFLNTVLLPEKRNIKEGEVREERERGILRATELRSSLINLNTLSNDQTRRLDDTYYSVLEKLAFLQSSLATFKEVASATRKIKVDFQAESTDLVEEIKSQISAFSDFSSQETRIKDLASRVQIGRAKIATLSERVDVVRTKVEGYEFADAEWQDKTRRRLRVMWIVMSFITVFVIVLVVFRYTPAKPFGPGVIHGLDETELRIPGVDGENSTWSLKREIEGGRERGESMLDRLRRTLGEREREKVEEGAGDDRLRVFDEL